MAEFSAAIPACVNILLRILSREVNVVAQFALGLASCAGVPVRNVESARVTCVPIREQFNKVGERGPHLLRHATLRVVSSVRGKVV